MRPVDHGDNHAGRSPLVVNERSCTVHEHRTGQVPRQRTELMRADGASEGGGWHGALSSGHGGHQPGGGANQSAALVAGTLNLILFYTYIDVAVRETCP